MIETMIKYLTNPVTSAILFDLEEMGESTAKQIGSRHSDIPQATLYRSLTRMVKDGIIEIVRENAVRGTSQKVYSLCSGYSNNINDALFDKNGSRAENFNEEYLKYFIQFAKGLIKEFQEFATNENAKDLDCGGFTINSFYASSTELKTLHNQILNSISEMQDNQQEEDRQLRSVAVIIPPAKVK